jgi:hypothetical protein
MGFEDALALDSLSAAAVGGENRYLGAICPFYNRCGLSCYLTLDEGQT